MASVNIPQTFMLGPEYVQKIWEYWLRHDGNWWVDKHTVPARIEYMRPYWQISRGYGEGAVFENWLFKQGVGIRQVKGDLCLEFTDEPAMTMFMLKWLS